ncbi:type I-B CRISPR-associated protein Cas5 [Paenibacillus tyrfis]|uniref:CRISPR-associated protein Cas5 n=1 Tax=Paenibacillus tyrfis TaxID=1501230 RepID=UPI0024904BA0|nr:CRISPR-associated protein Cas5 [Paenibacillus tyrfis]GLI07648.1 type I-B CRISPR-associated protein Cas5 [Paenibacillus tyrfis]
MKTVVFEVRGNFAHFRKFYANSTSLSYEFPPRTTACGMIAAILGMERDSYYELMSEEQAFVCVQIMEPVKRMSQTVNYMWVKGTKDLNGSAGPMQIPVEWVTNIDGVGKGEVGYRIYFSHRDEALLEKLSSLLKENQTYYPIYLGLSEALGHVRWIGEFELEHVDESDELIEISTVCPIEQLQDIFYVQAGEGGQVRKYMRDRIPCDFAAERRLTGVAQVIYEPNGHPITARVKHRVYRLRINDEPLYILPLTSRE